mgnify:CR=1 FL=1
MLEASKEMKSEFTAIIRDLDGTLAFLKSNWIAAPATEKHKWMDKINNALDQRLLWMKKRDATT